MTPTSSPRCSRRPADNGFCSPKRRCTAIIAARRLAGAYRVDGIYQIMLDPNPGTVTWTLPWNTPWRVAMIGETLGPIVESTLVDNLNPVRSEK